MAPTRPRNERDQSPPVANPGVRNTNRRAVPQRFPQMQFIAAPRDTASPTAGDAWRAAVQQHRESRNVYWGSGPTAEQMEYVNQILPPYTEDGPDSYIIFPGGNSDQIPLPDPNLPSRNSPVIFSSDESRGSTPPSGAVGWSRPMPSNDSVFPLQSSPQPRNVSPVAPLASSSNDQEERGGGGDMDVDDDEEETHGLKCPICYDIFVQPKILYCCGQSICENCEENSRSRGSSATQWNCPFCRSHGTLRGILPVNITLRNAVESMKNRVVHRVTCHECNSKVDVSQVFRCTTCNPSIQKKLCSRCGFKNHRGHDVEEMQFVSTEDRKKAVDALRIAMNFGNGIRSADEDLQKIRLAIMANHSSAQRMCNRILNNNRMTAEEVERALQETKKCMQSSKDLHGIIAAIHNPEIELEVRHINRDAIAEL